MKCRVCGIKLNVECRPDDNTMPCNIAPRHYVERNPDKPARVVAVTESCPFEPERTPDFLPKTSMMDFTGKERREAKANVEKFYADPQDFRPTGHRKDHSAPFASRGGVGERPT